MLTRGAHQPETSMVTITLGQLYALVASTAGLTGLVVWILAWRTEVAARGAVPLVAQSAKHALEVSRESAETVHLGLTQLLECAAAMQQGQVSVLSQLSTVIAKDYNGRAFSAMENLISRNEPLVAPSHGGLNTKDADALALLARRIQEGAPDEAVVGLELRDTIPAGELTGNASV